MVSGISICQGLEFLLIYLFALAAGLKLINSIKKGSASAKAAPLGVGFVAFGEAVQVG